MVERVCFELNYLRLQFTRRAHIFLSCICGIHFCTGIKVVSGATAKEVTKEADGTLSVHLENGEVRVCCYLILSSQCIPQTSRTTSNISTLSRLVIAIYLPNLYLTLPLLLPLYFSPPQTLTGFEVLLAATGRHPLTATLNLDSVGVNTKKGGFVEVSAHTDMYFWFVLGA